MKKTNEQLLAELKARAVKQNERYPQYDKHFDNYVLVKVKKAVRTKMGKAFDKDEISIANPDVRKEDIFVNKYGATNKKKMYTVYSFKNEIDTVISAEIEFI